jgi:BirA family biotin operon repressor/biotin-[acetyl-CoA-carboxylase] ligase
MHDPGATWPVPSLAGAPREWPPGWHVGVVDETGSTNADLVVAARAGARDRTVLCARHQTAGRGRLDRRWEAPPGANLLVSLLLRDVPEHPHEVTQRVALAARSAVRSLAGVDAALKWPNDLLVDGAKLAGVLAESVAGPSGIEAVVVGLGLNVGWAIPGAARLDDHAEGLDPLEVLAAVLRAYDDLPREIVGMYRAALATLGTLVRIERAQGDLVGVATDVCRDGRLEVTTPDGVVHDVDTGDVVHLRPA